MEGRLKTQDKPKSQKTNESNKHEFLETVFEPAEPVGMQAGVQQSMPGVSYDSVPTNDPIMLPVTNMAPVMMPDKGFMPQIDLDLEQSFSWEMIGLGLEEPMPTQEAVDELYDLRPPTSWYADKIKEHRSSLINYIRLYP